MPKRSLLLVLVAWSATATPMRGDPAESAPAAITDPQQADADFAMVGEYSGQFQGAEGKLVKLGVQVALLNNEQSGMFRAAGFVGGLPGDGGGGRYTMEGRGKRAGNGAELELLGYRHSGDKYRPYWNFQGTARIAGGMLSVFDPDGKLLGELPRVERKSPTLGAQPPQGALLLFDGGSAENFQDRGRPVEMTADGLLVAGCKTKRDFAGGFTLHLEFRIPYRCTKGKGNSGVFLQDTYEIQVFDSLAHQPAANGCGGLYVIKRPDLNMTYPPLAWQTYDVQYTAPRFDQEGKVATAPRVTVRHNGTMIHDDVELPIREKQLSPAGGPIQLQAHGSPVHYRNVWVVEGTP